MLYIVKQKKMLVQLILSYSQKKNKIKNSFWHTPYYLINKLNSTQMLLNNETIIKPTGSMHNCIQVSE